MDIDLLSKMVKELILDNDRVVLPGLGSFVAEVVPATFSDKGYTINPPYRKLYFRSRPDEGTELAVFYAKSNSVPEDVAEKVIADFIAELKSVLFVKKTVIFPGLGRLRATKENNVFFVSDEDLDIYPEGFGLQAISLKTHQESREEVSAAVGELKSILEEPVAVSADPEPVAVVAESESVTVVVELEQVPAEVEPEPEPVAAEPEPVEATSEPAPEPESTPEPEPAPELEPAPDTAQDAPEPELKVVEEETERKPRRTLKMVGKVLIWTVAVVVVALVAYVAIGRLCPDWLDTYLYSPEELEILKNM